MAFPVRAKTLTAIGAGLALASAWGAEAPKESKEAVPSPPPVFQLRPLELLRPFPPVRTLPATFPVTEPVQSVEGLAAVSGKVWILAKPVSISTLPGRSSHLWLFNPVDNQMSPLGDWFENHFPSAMLGWERRLWLTGGENVAGIGALDILDDDRFHASTSRVIGNRR